jgi:hypothetical protein
VDPADRRRLLVALAEASIMLAAAWLLDPARPPLRPTLWYGAMRASQASARVLADLAWSVGRVAIASEMAYRKEIQP